MLACLPGPGDLSLQLHPHSQMNTGLQKWDTTQRMRSTQYPTPAELDAYAKKVANNPLTIKIFPNSVKVPQRNHVRRTVNGLDTAGSRYSPYPSAQSTAKTGLLAIVKVPLIKGVIKDFDGTRARLPPEVVMNNVTGPYASNSASTLNLHHPSQGPPGASQNPQGLQPHPRNVQQVLQPVPPHPGLRHGTSSMPQPPQGLGRPQTLSHAASLGHPGSHPSAAIMLPQQHLQHPPVGLQVSARKLPIADAPPNVTVSTSTIPLSMASGLHQGQPADLNSIVHQISQFCQSRAQVSGTTSMCDGQIANPSPISRNLLINASSRVSMHAGNPIAPPASLMHPSCTHIGPPDEVTACGAASAMPPHNMATLNHMYHSDMKQQHVQHHSQPPQRNPQHMRLWNQHQLAHLQHMSDRGGHPCKLPTRDPGLTCKGINYPPEMTMGQPYTMKPCSPSPPLANNNANAMHQATITHYTNGQYYQQPQMWGGILPTPTSDSSSLQDLPLSFHGSAGTCTGNTNPTPGMECTPTGGAHYRLVGGALIGQTNLMQTSDCMGGDFQTPCFRDQNLILMGKMHRPPPMGRVMVPPSESHGQIQGYR